MGMDERSNLQRHVTNYKSNKGFILIMVLLLLTTLSLSAFVAVEQSQFSYKVNHARVSKLKARQISDDARLAAINKLVFMLKNDDLKIGDGSIKKSLSRYKKDGLWHFLSLNQNDKSADVYVKKLPTQTLKNGVSLLQSMAYSSMGLGLGNQGSFSVRYEVRAKGIAQDKGSEVTFWTASDYRFTP
tara:strand:- start:272 stop:829 length:558 start_codon:yes stop_codon:yes gene_type:complete